ncbi:hypothetical protein [Pseudomonas huaxiensis]|uniref:hypothetical protein n=1 Tax=Pseudomonas huaxiensis TaxID=2213017 RepID=UPI001CDCF522|nr:hypothetical protein [Pseudomonas huaxiensis]
MESTYMLDFLSSLFFELIAPVLRALFYPLGWPLVKLITLGRYPQKGSWLRDTRQADITAIIGLAVALVGMMAALQQFRVV